MNLSSMTQRLQSYNSGIRLYILDSFFKHNSYPCQQVNECADFRYYTKLTSSDQN